MPSLTLAQIALLVSVTLLFAVQIYYIWLYRRVSRAAGLSAEASEQGISVVIIVRDSFDFAANILPSLLAQSHSKFEIVLVDIGSSEEFLFSLKAIEKQNPKLRVTSLRRDNRFRITTKMAYNVGIKAATHENIILSTTTSHPVSEKWLATMAEGFDRGSVVLGYCAVERTRGLCNRIVRTSRALMSLRYFAAALDGRPYRGVIQNIGFTQKEYFAAHGFNHLSINIGEDDLFIQKIATPRNTAIVVNPDATTSQIVSGDGIPSWNAQRTTNAYCYNLYPTPIKQYLAVEIISHTLFLIVAIVGIAILPLYFKIGVAALVIARFVWLSIVLRKFSKAVGDRGVTITLVINDLMAPLTELWLYLQRKVISPKKLWR